MLVSKFSCAGLMVSVAVRTLLPLVPPAGFSRLVVVMVAVLSTVRAGLPARKLGRNTAVTLWVSPFARVPMVQLKSGVAGMICAPAAMLQLDPERLEAIDTTVKPVSPAAKLKPSATTTPWAVDGPLLR
ncbi:MAG: hypothetical protein QE285_12655 [Aquabacterium sp.]|nr:hypothetical protein [Aquabacterium sp.]